MRIATDGGSVVYVAVETCKVLSVGIALGRRRRELFVNEVLKLRYYRVEVDIYLP